VIVLFVIFVKVGFGLNRVWSVCDFCESRFWIES